MQRQAQPGKEAEVDACRQGVKKELGIPSIPLTKIQASNGKAELGAGEREEAVWRGDVGTS